MNHDFVSSKLLAGGLVIAPIVIAVVAGCTFLKTPTASAKVAHDDGPTTPAEPVLVFNIDWSSASLLRSFQNVTYLFRSLM
jgi:hypothetical protein